MTAARRAGSTALIAALAGITGIGLTRRHRQVRRAADGLRGPAAYVPLPITAATLPVMRRFTALSLRAPVPKGVRRVEIPTAAGKTVVGHLHEPDTDQPRGALLWLHGGGRVLGSPAQDHDLCQSLANAAGVLVLASSYRLAPEHPFPAALDDAVAALRWLDEHCAGSGVPTRLAVGGASAGGGLAAEVAQWAADHDTDLVLQLLLYPMLDDRTLDHGPGDRGHLVWTPQANRFGWSAYLGHPAGQREDLPYAVAARRPDLSRLAPAWIGVGDLDLFYEEDTAYASRLAAAGVPVDLDVVPRMYHGVDALPATASAAASTTIRRAMVAALVDAYEEPTSVAR